MTWPVVRYYRDLPFQVAERVQFQTEICEACDGPPFVSLTADGLLTIEVGFAWNGADHLSRFDPTIVRGSLAHDALYLLFRRFGLPLRWRPAADRLMRDLFEADGMNPGMARWVESVVARHGLSAADGSWQRPVLEAPAPITPQPEPYLP